jgi:hypothetical protein
MGLELGYVRDASEGGLLTLIRSKSKLAQADPHFAKETVPQSGISAALDPESSVESSAVDRSSRPFVLRPLLLLGAVVVIRSAGFAFGVLNIDESDYMVFGTALFKGLLPYRDLVEIKPPLGYFTYAPSALFGGQSILPMRVLGVLWLFATALVLREVARRWTKDELAGWCAAWLCLIANLVEVPSFSSEVMMNLPIALALLAFLEEEMLLAGLAVGVASLYRHQAGIAAVALGMVVLRHPRKFGLLFLGTILPWLAAAGAYAAIGQAGSFVEWAIVRNFTYVGHGGNGVLERAAQSILLCVGATILPWALAARQSFRERSGFGLALSLLLWLTWIAVAMGGRFYEHYFIQFVPPLAVLGAPLAASLWQRRRALFVALAAIPLALNVGFSWARGLAGKYPAQEPKTRQVAQFLREHSAPDERLFVWGHYTPIYTLSGRLPGTRYPNTSLHMGNFDPLLLDRQFDAAAHRSAPDVRATLDDLTAKKPALVVDTAPADIHGWSRIPLSAFPVLKSYVDTHYDVIGHPAGAVVYRLRSSTTIGAR